MNRKIEMEENPKELARLSFWSEEVYRDLLACQKGEMPEESFNAKYHKKAAILCLDTTGFTRTTLKHSALYSFFRILNVQKICYPVFKLFKAEIIHTFADNFTVIFSHPKQALESALEVHKRIEAFNKSLSAKIEDTAQCCIGIGHDQAMGEEMNKASVLGEDTAKGSETLVTENVYKELKDDPELKAGCKFTLQMQDDVPFPFYEVTVRE
jgi:adenylate cyclase